MEYITCKRAPAALLAWSTAVTMMRLTPGFSEMLQENAPADVATTEPLQATEEIGVREAATDPVTVILEEVTEELSAGEDTVTAGGVVSILTVAVVETEKPAWSVTVPVTV